MRRITRVIIVLIHLSYFTHAQNLVINGGIDAYITCPGFGQFSNAYIVGWDKPSYGSSDYYNYNCVAIQPTVQDPFSGEGYAGIIAYNYGTEYREYITGTFSTPLVAGTIYNVSFQASLNDGYIQAVVELGAYISNTMPGPFPNALHINVVPQIENTSGFIADTANWKIISGQFMANGGEQYITIGNFHDDSTTTISQPGTSGSFGAYYFIDGVTVEPDTTATALQEWDPAVTDLYFSGENLIISSKNSHLSLMITGYKTDGSKMFEQQVKGHSASIDFSKHADGIYFFRISEGKKWKSKVLVKM